MGESLADLLAPDNGGSGTPADKRDTQDATISVYDEIERMSQNPDAIPPSLRGLINQLNEGELDVREVTLSDEFFTKPTGQGKTGFAFAYDEVGNQYFLGARSRLSDERVYDPIYARESSIVIFYSPEEQKFQPNRQRATNAIKWATIRDPNGRSEDSDWGKISSEFDARASRELNTVILEERPGGGYEFWVQGDSRDEPEKNYSLYLPTAARVRFKGDLVPQYLESLLLRAGELGREVEILGRLIDQPISVEKLDPSDDEIEQAVDSIRSISDSTAEIRTFLGSLSEENADIIRKQLNQLESSSLEYAEAISTEGEYSPPDIETQNLRLASFRTLDEMKKDKLKNTKGLNEEEYERYSGLLVEMKNALDGSDVRPMAVFTDTEGVVHNLSFNESQLIERELPVTLRLLPDGSIGNPSIYNMNEEFHPDNIVPSTDKTYLRLADYERYSLIPGDSYAASVVARSLTLRGLPIETRGLQLYQLEYAKRESYEKVYEEVYLRLHAAMVDERSKKELLDVIDRSSKAISENYRDEYIVLDSDSPTIVQALSLEARRTHRTSRVSLGLPVSNRASYKDTYYLSQDEALLSFGFRADSVEPTDLASPKLTRLYEKERLLSYHDFRKRVAEEVGATNISHLKKVYLIPILETLGYSAAQAEIYADILANREAQLSSENRTPYIESANLLYETISSELDNDELPIRIRRKDVITEVGGPDIGFYEGSAATYNRIYEVEIAGYRFQGRELVLTLTDPMLPYIWERHPNESESAFKVTEGRRKRKMESGAQHEEVMEMSPEVRIAIKIALLEELGRMTPDPAYRELTGEGVKQLKDQALNNLGILRTQFAVEDQIIEENESFVKEFRKVREILNEEGLEERYISYLQGEFFKQLSDRDVKDVLLSGYQLDNYFKSNPRSFLEDQIYYQQKETGYPGDDLMISKRIKDKVLSKRTEYREKVRTLEIALYGFIQSDPVISETLLPQLESEGFRFSIISPEDLQSAIPQEYEKFFGLTDNEVSDDGFEVPAPHLYLTAEEKEAGYIPILSYEYEYGRPGVIAVIRLPDGTYKAKQKRLDEDDAEFGDYWGPLSTKLNEPAATVEELQRRFYNTLGYQFNAEMIPVEDSFGGGTSVGDPSSIEETQNGNQTATSQVKVFDSNYRAFETVELLKLTEEDLLQIMDSSYRSDFGRWRRSFGALVSKGSVGFLSLADLKISKTDLEDSLKTLRGDRKQLRRSEPEGFIENIATYDKILLRIQYFHFLQEATNVIKDSDDRLDERQRMLDAFLKELETADSTYLRRLDQGEDNEGVIYSILEEILE